MAAPKAKSGTAKKRAAPASRGKAATGRKKPASGQRRGSKGAAKRSRRAGFSLPSARTLFVGAMRLALVCMGIFGVGLILGLYFSQSPPREPYAEEASADRAPSTGTQIARPPVPEEANAADAYRLSRIPDPPKVKPAPPEAETAALAPAPEPPAPEPPAPEPGPKAAPRPAAAPQPVASPVVPEAVEQPLWLAHSVPVDASPSRPWIAIVLDDVGVNRATAWEAIELPAPLTLAFMTYAGDLQRMTGAARARGHELMVHFPMEPSNLVENDPGENALLLDLPPQEIERRLDWGLARFDGYVGLNNHMGSRFTEDAEAMGLVMVAARERGLMFLDSRTSAKSVAGRVAREHGLPVLTRDVFLDHEPNEDFVRKQLAELERLAEKRGYAIGIGHPQDYTLSVLRTWIASAQARGFEIVPLTAIVKRRGDLG